MPAARSLTVFDMTEVLDVEHDEDEGVVAVREEDVESELATLDGRYSTRAAGQSERPV